MTPEDSMRDAARASAQAAFASQEAVEILTREVRELRKTVEAAYRATRWRLAGAVASIVALVATLVVGGVLLWHADQRTERSLRQVHDEVVANNAKFCSLTGAISSGSPPQTSYGRELRQRAAELYDALGCDEQPAAPLP